MVSRQREIGLASDIRLCVAPLTVRRTHAGHDDTQLKRDTKPNFQEINMSRQYTASSTIRTAFERAFAGVVFASMIALTLGGTIAMCFSNAPFMA